MQWIDKDELGWAVWRFWLCLIGVVLSFSVLTGFMALAINAERNAGKREHAFYQKGGLEAPTSSTTSTASSAPEHPVLIEATSRSLKVIGWPCLALILLVSLNLWWLKRETPAYEPEAWEDPVAKGRTVR